MILMGKYTRDVNLEFRGVEHMRIATSHDLCGFIVPAQSHSSLFIYNRIIILRLIAIFLCAIRNFICWF